MRGGGWIRRGLVAIGGSTGDARTATALFGQGLLLSLSKTYGVRMAAVFMISLAAIWLETGLMPRWLVGITYVTAVGLLLLSDLSMWILLAFPAWVLIVSLLALVRAGVIDLHHNDTGISGERAGRTGSRRVRGPSGWATTPSDR